MKITGVENVVNESRKSVSYTVWNYNDHHLEVFLDAKYGELWCERVYNGNHIGYGNNFVISVCELYKPITEEELKSIVAEKYESYYRLVTRPNAMLTWLRPDELQKLEV